MYDVHVCIFCILVRCGTFVSIPFVSSPIREPFKRTARDTRVLTETNSSSKLLQIMIINKYTYSTSIPTAHSYSILRPGLVQLPQRQCSLQDGLPVSLVFRIQTEYLDHSVDIQHVVHSIGDELLHGQPHRPDAHTAGELVR